MAAKLFQMILIKQSTEGTLRMHFHSAIYNCCGQSKKITGLFRCRSVPLIKILQLSSNCNELTYYHTHQLLIVIVKAQLPLEKIMILEHITRQGRTQWRTPPRFDLLFLLSQIRPILTAAGLSISAFSKSLCLLFFPPTSLLNYNLND